MYLSTIRAPSATPLAGISLLEWKFWASVRHSIKVQNRQCRLGCVGLSQPEIAGCFLGEKSSNCVLCSDTSGGPNPNRRSTKSISKCTKPNQTSSSKGVKNTLIAHPWADHQLPHRANIGARREIPRMFSGERFGRHVVLHSASTSRLHGFHDAISGAASDQRLLKVVMRRVTPYA